MNLRSLVQFIHSERRNAALCEACGNEFVCGAVALAGCWCGEIKLTDEIRAKLRELYERCLCRDCLERFSKGSDSEKK